MFKGFGAARPKVEDPRDWTDILPMVNTEKNRQRMKHQSKGYNNDEDAESRAQAHTNDASHSRVNDDEEVRSSSSVVPLSTSTSDKPLSRRRALFRSMHNWCPDGEISSTTCDSISSTLPDEVKEQPPVKKSGSIESSKPERPSTFPNANHTTTTNTLSPTANQTTTATTTNDAIEYEDLYALKAAEAKKDKEKAATVPTNTTKGGFGFGIQWDPFTNGFDFGRGSSWPESSTVATTTVPSTAVFPHYTCTMSSASAGFGGFSDTSATVPTVTATSSGGFGFGIQWDPSSAAGFGNRSAIMAAPAATPPFDVFASRPTPTSQSSLPGMFFEDVHELKKAAHAKEMEVAKRLSAAGVGGKEKSPVEESDSDDDSEPTHRAMPWGRRPCFRAMLEGGRKKLVLESPPSGVSTYFLDQVYRSYGCTYDSVSGTFYATSPGGRGQKNGQVVAMAGNCQTAPVCVTRELLEPAAIAVYEPGLSVCVVTNRGIFVFTRQFDQQGEATGKYLSRQISYKGFHRGIAATGHGGIVSFSNGRIRMFDGTVENGEERVLAETNYDLIINSELFADNPHRRAEKSNCCFMDIVENRLVMSDLQKRVISLWRIDESATYSTTITFVCAVDVAISANQTGHCAKGISSSRIPPGKCCYASGIRLDAEGWVLCADADGRTIQIYDDQLNFVTRIDPPPGEGLPYISGLYIEAGGHLMVCDRKSEMGGLRVYVLESVEKTPGEREGAEFEDRHPSFGFGASSRF